ncbi:hypothetical protein LZ32DRAFT_623154 [Colletotrichum eremochloae]|nr:hypothetical protein LZ32DRAFT_623154 [Colletotrichum eremochloae]
MGGIVKEYAESFSDDAGNGDERHKKRLKSLDYRKILEVPATNSNGRLVFDKGKKPKSMQVKVRQQEKNSIGLLYKHPERAITYPWVSEEHKKQYGPLARLRQTQLDSAIY